LGSLLSFLGWLPAELSHDATQLSPLALSNPRKSAKEKFLGNSGRFMEQVVIINPTSWQWTCTYTVPADYSLPVASTDLANMCSDKTQ